MNIIKVNNLLREFKIAKSDGSFLAHLFRRKFETIKAVDNVNFAIKKGELVGFIGPNGAGKSTTIKMLSGILVPTSGEIRVFDSIPHKNRKENAKKIGVVFGQRSQLWWDLPVYDTFLLLKKIYNVSDETFSRNIEVFESRLDIKSFYKQPVRQLSLGQRMRADIAASLLHDPELIFLDEPTIGLDVVVKNQIREFIKEINYKRNVTVILTTHDMRDIEEICNRIIMIDKGSVVLDMPVTDVSGNLGGTIRVVMDFEEIPNKVDIPSKVKIIERVGPRWIFSFSSTDLTVGQFISSVLSKHRIIDVSVKKAEIEDVIRDIYTGKIRLDYGGNKPDEQGLKQYESTRIS